MRSEQVWWTSDRRARQHHSCVLHAKVWRVWRKCDRACFSRSSLSQNTLTERRHGNLDAVHYRIRSTGGVWVGDFVLITLPVVVWILSNSNCETGAIAIATTRGNKKSKCCLTKAQIMSLSPTTKISSVEWWRLPTVGVGLIFDSVAGSFLTILANAAAPERLFCLRCPQSW